MNEAADALAAAARNRGLKLVRSRVRSPEKRGFGKLGLTDRNGEPVFGIKNGKPAAKPEAVADYLRGAEASEWKASLKQAGGKVTQGSRHKVAPQRDEAQRNSIAPSNKTKRQADAPPSPAPKLNVREAKPRDASRLVKLFALLDHLLNEVTVTRNLKVLAKAGEPMLVIERGKEVLGACGIHRMLVPHRAKPVGRITILVIAETDRKSGLGRILVEEAERRLGKLGCGMVEITSNDRLREAHAFYRHLGYERTSMRFAKALPSG